jgi:ATP adenylyltransferase
MKQLFAPWRMSYILAGEEQAPECIFCAFPQKGRAHYRDHLILVAQPHAFVMMNKFPYGNGHVMVVPRRHVARPAELEPAEWSSICELLRQSVVAVGEALSAKDANIGMNLGRVAGAGIENHCHWHVVPRWSGDVNFMPLFSETKVISEHLESTYARLLPRFLPFGEGPLG